MSGGLLPEVEDAFLKFQREGCEVAFRVVVESYSGLVHSAALRISGDSSLAEEAAQHVFLALARKVKSFDGGSQLGAWLHRAGVNEAKALVRREVRHRKRGEKYSELMSQGSERSQVAGMLDDELDRLPLRDRELLIRHYYEGKTFREIGLETGDSEAACQRRAWRLVKKLRDGFERRGVTVATGVVVAILGGEFAKGASVGVSGRIWEGVSSGLGGGVGGGGVSSTTFVFMKKYLMTGGVLAGLCFGGAYQVGRLSEGESDRKFGFRGFWHSSEVGVGGVGRGGERSGVEYREVEELLDLALEKLRDGDLGELAEAREILRGVRPGDHQKAINLLDVWSDYEQELEALLIGSWALVDVVGARTYLEGREGKKAVEDLARKEFYRSWASVDGEGAWEDVQPFSKEMRGWVLR